MAYRSHQWVRGTARRQRDRRPGHLGRCLLDTRRPRRVDYRHWPDDQSAICSMQVSQAQPSPPSCRPSPPSPRRRPRSTLIMFRRTSMWVLSPVKNGGGLRHLSACPGRTMLDGRDVSVRGLSPVRRLVGEVGVKDPAADTAWNSASRPHHATSARSPPDHDASASSPTSKVSSPSKGCSDSHTPWISFWGAGHNPTNVTPAGTTRRRHLVD